jgi:hypothetical protein
MFAAVGALVEPNARRALRAADDRPRLPLAAPHPRVDDVRVRRIELEVSRADAVGEEQHFLPRLSTVGRLEDAALGVRLERIADRGDPRDVRIRRVNAHGADLTGVVQSGKAPRLSGVGRFVDTASCRDIATNVVGPGAEVDDIGVRLRDGD